MGAVIVESAAEADPAFAAAGERALRALQAES